MKRISLVNKWRSKPVQDKAERKRENQRRHRQRVKARIEHLESNLEDTQLRLDEALERVAELTLELTRNKMKDASMDLLAPDVEEEYPKCNAEYTSNISTGSQPQNSNQDPVWDLPPLPCSTYQTSEVPNSVMDTETCPASANCGPANAVAAMQPGSMLLEDYQEADDDELPRPRPGISTTRCRDAHVIIMQQNYKGLSSAEICGWLQPGFRKASLQGDGCRVETEVLFALLDYISSTPS